VRRRVGKQILGQESQVQRTASGRLTGRFVDPREPVRRTRSDDEIPRPEAAARSKRSKKRASRRADIDDALDWMDAADQVVSRKRRPIRSDYEDRPAAPRRETEGPVDEALGWMDELAGPFEDVVRGERRRPGSSGERARRAGREARDPRRSSATGRVHPPPRPPKKEKEQPDREPSRVETRPVARPPRPTTRRVERPRPPTRQAERPGPRSPRPPASGSPRRPAPPRGEAGPLDDAPRKARPVSGRLKRTHVNEIMARAEVVRESSGEARRPSRTVERVEPRHGSGPLSASEVWMLSLTPEEALEAPPRRSESPEPAATAAPAEPAAPPQPERPLPSQLRSRDEPIGLVESGEPTGDGGLDARRRQEVEELLGWATDLLGTVDSGVVEPAVGEPDPEPPPERQRLERLWVDVQSGEISPDAYLDSVAELIDDVRERSGSDDDALRAVVAPDAPPSSRSSTRILRLQRQLAERERRLQEGASAAPAPPAPPLRRPTVEPPAVWTASPQRVPDSFGRTDEIAPDPFANDPFAADPFAADPFAGVASDAPRKDPRCRDPFCTDPRCRVPPKATPLPPPPAPLPDLPPR